MSSSSRGPPTVAFVEDCDDDNSELTGDSSTRIYATHSYSHRPSPSREQPNTGKSRRGDASASNSDSAPRSSKKKSDREREERRRAERELDERAAREKARKRKEKAEAKAGKDTSTALKKVRDRPSHLRQTQTQPVVQQVSGYRRGHDEPSYYGVQTPASSMNRPRANTRPASYYAGQTRGPPQGSHWIAQSPMASGGPPHGFPPHAPSPYGGPPPPPSQYGGPPPGMYGAPPPPSPTGPHSYFEGHGRPMPIPQQPSRGLRDRFERPSSAMGFSQSPAGSFEQPYDDYYYQQQFDEPSYNPKRRSKQLQQEEDRKRMPPPPKFKPQKEMPRRPSTTAPSSAPFQPPPQRPASRQQSRPPIKHMNRRSINGLPVHYPPAFDEDDSDDDGGLFNDSPDPPIHDYRSRKPTGGRARRESKLIYEYDDTEYEPASGRASRRGSMYVPGGGGASLEHESRMDSAKRYLEEVGGPQTPLTAETLRKASKDVASSRSTRSSASRDESDYKQRSNTTGITGITRSSSGGNGDPFTMKINGKAVVRIGDAEIDCEDSEITFSHGHSDMPRGSIGGSEDASTVYQLEDQPTRARSMKALPHRPRDRASSQADSASRGYGGNSHQYAPYEAYDRY